MPNKFFPVSIDLNNKNILVIGAGKIALRKVNILSNDDIQISITANGNPKKAVEVKNKIKDYLIKE